MRVACFRLVVLLLFFVITTSSSSHFSQALNIKFWPKDFAGTSSPNIISNLTKNEGLVLNAFPARDSSLTITNCVLSSIAVAISDATPKFLHSLFHLRGSTHLTIENSSIGSFILSNVMSPRGFVQLNDQSKIVIRNNIFRPIPGITPTGESLVRLVLRLNSSNAQVEARNNTFYSPIGGDSGEAMRMNPFAIVIASPPYRTNDTSAMVTNETEESENQDTILPSRFDSIQIVNNNLFVDLAPGICAFQLRFDFGRHQLSSNKSLTPSGEYVSTGNLINVSGNNVLVEKALEIWSGTYSYGLVVNVRDNKDLNGTILDAYTFQFQNVVVDDNNVTIVSLWSMGVNAIRFDMSLMINLVSVGSRWSFCRNVVWKNSTLLIGRDENLINGPETETFFSSFKGVTVDVAVAGVTSKSSSSSSSSITSGTILLTDNNVTGCGNSFAGVQLTLTDSKFIDLLQLSRNRVVAHLFLECSGVRVLTHNTFTNINRIELVENHIELYNIAAVAANASTRGDSNNFQIRQMDVATGVDVRGWEVSKLEAASERYWDKIQAILMDRNDILLTGRQDTLACSIYHRMRGMGSLLVRNNTARVISFSIKPSSPTAIQKGGKQEGDDTKYDDVPAKQVSGLRIAPGFDGIESVEASGNNFYLRSNVTGTLGGVCLPTSEVVVGLKSLRVFNNTIKIDKLGFDVVEVSTAGVVMSSRQTSGGHGLWEIFDNDIDIFVLDHCPPGGCCGFDQATSNTVLLDRWTVQTIRIFNNRIKIHNSGEFVVSAVTLSVLGLSSGVVITKLAYVLVGGNFSLQSLWIENNNFTAHAKAAMSLLSIPLAGEYRGSSIVVRGNNFTNAYFSSTTSSIIRVACPFGKLVAGGLTMTIRCDSVSRVTLANSFGPPYSYSSPPALFPHPGLVVASNVAVSISSLVYVESLLDAEDVILRNNSLVIGDMDQVIAKIPDNNALRSQSVLLAIVHGASQIRRQLVIEYSSIRSSTFVYCDDPTKFEVANRAAAAVSEMVSYDMAGIMTASSMLKNDAVLAQSSFTLIIRNVTAEFRCRIPSRFFPAAGGASNEDATGVSLINLKYPAKQMLIENVNVKITTVTDDNNNNNGSGGSEQNPLAVKIGLMSFFGLVPSTSSSLAVKTQLNISSVILATPALTSSPSASAAAGATSSSSSSSSSLFTTNAFLVRNPVPFYSSTDLRDNKASSFNTIARVDCVTWNGNPLSYKSDLVKASPLDLARSLIGCNGKYGLSRTGTPSPDFTETAVRASRTSNETRTQSTTVELPVEIGGFSEKILQQLYGASIGSTAVAAVVGGSPATLLSGSNGIALVQLARCALDYEANGGDAYHSAAKAANHSRFVLSQPVAFPRTFLPNLKIGGSEYRGAAVSHMIVFLLLLLVTLFVGSVKRSLWKERALARNGTHERSSRNKATKTERDTSVDTLSVGLFALWDYILLRTCIVVVSLGGDIAGALINGSPANAGDIALGVIVHSVVGFAVVSMAAYFWYESRPNNVTKSKKAGARKKKASNYNDDDDGDEAEAKPRFYTESSELYFARSSSNLWSALQQRSPRFAAFAASVRRFLQSKFSRFCLIGDVVYFNKYSDLEQATTHFGPGIQTQFSFIFRKMIGPQKNDPVSALYGDNKKKHERGSRNNNGRTRLNSFSTLSTSMNSFRNASVDGFSSPQGSLQELSTRRRFDMSLRLRLAPYYLFVACICSMVIMSNSGAGSVAPQNCKVHFVVSLSFLVVSSLFLFFTRPYNVPARNVASILIDFCVLVGASILCGLVFETSSSSSSSSGAAGQGSASRSSFGISTQQDALIKLAQLLCSLAPTILGSAVSISSFVRFALVQLSQALVVTRTSVRLNLPKELDSLQEEMLEPFLLASSLNHDRTSTLPPRTLSSATSTPSSQTAARFSPANVSIGDAPIKSSPSRISPSSRSPRTTDRKKFSSSSKSSSDNNNNNNHEKRQNLPQVPPTPHQSSLLEYPQRKRSETVSSKSDAGKNRGGQRQQQQQQQQQKREPDETKAHSSTRRRPSNSMVVMSSSERFALQNHVSTL